MRLVKVNGVYQVECKRGERVNGHCPSVDVLFESVAKTAGQIISDLRHSIHYACRFILPNRLGGEPYDLVCLDIMMPVMDGYQSLLGIRNLEKERNIPDHQTS